MSTVQQGWTITGVDANNIRIEETIEGNQVVVSIQQNDEKGRIATVCLNKAQWLAFCELKYKVNLYERAQSEEGGEQ